MKIIRNYSVTQKIHMEQRIAERNGTHLLDYAEQHGMGTQKHLLVTIR